MFEKIQWILTIELRQLSIFNNLSVNKQILMCSLVNMHIMYCN